VADYKIASLEVMQGDFNTTLNIFYHPDLIGFDGCSAISAGETRFFFKSIPVSTSANTMLKHMSKQKQSMKSVETGGFSLEIILQLFSLGIPVAPLSCIF
jgi:hypothetical protein